MTLPMAAWRVTYTPGNWLVLSGPTMLVVMLPAPARMSGLVNSLWGDVVQARSVDGLLELLASYGLDNMPDFAAFFWDTGGLHGLARGRIKVVDTDTGQDAVNGEGVVTWREESLGGARHLRVDMEPVDQDAVLQLPLVVGAASASAIYLTTDSESVIRFPTYDQLGILPKVAALGVRPRDARRAVDAEGDAVAADASEVAPDDTAPEPAAPEAHAAPADEPTPAVEAPVPAAAVEAPPVEEQPTALPAPEPEPEPEPQPEPEAEPVTLITPDPEPPIPTSPDVVAPLPTAPDPGDLDPDAFGTGALAFETEVVPAQSPVAPPAPPSAAAPTAPLTAVPTPSAVPPASVPSAAVPSASAPVVVPGNFTQPEEDDGGTIFSTGLAATHKPATQSESAPEAQVLAVPCSRGHANAPGARHCRLCSSPVDSSNARLIRRPALAGVNSNQGDFADINVAVIVGRAPDASKGPAGSHLMRVPSPSSDISRSHLLVQPRDWSIIVTDLNSTNGTTILPVGEQPFVLANGDSVQVELGTVLDLGDGVSLRIEPPRG